jgi:hypothetical protein
LLALILNKKEAVSEDEEANVMSNLNSPKVKVWSGLWLMLVRLLSSKGSARLNGNLRNQGIQFALSCIEYAESKFVQKLYLTPRFVTMLAVITINALIDNDHKHDLDSAPLSKALKRITDPYLAPSVRFESTVKHLTQASLPTSPDQTIKTKAAKIAL